MDFTDDQRRAILHGEGHLQLIACAGSGKTEVVAQRVAKLLDPSTSPRVLPANIIAFTFTEKAAAELKERIQLRCREVWGEMPGLAEMYVGTIHAFALDLIKSEVPKYMKFEVLNEVQASLFADRNSRGSGLTVSTDLQGAPLRRYIDTRHYLSALNILREGEPEDGVLDGNSVLQGLDLWHALLEKHRYLDYSEILEAAVEVLVGDEGVRERLSARVRHVIVDEYQDVNPIQEAIVWCLRDLGAQVCVVGDDDQTIYQWRGSDVRNILTFEDRYAPVRQVRLEENFRSSQGIIETARDFIRLNVERLPKEMKPAGRQTFEAGDLVALAFDDPDAEAGWIAETMKELRGVAIRDGDGERGIAWSDMAVLLRTVRKSGEPITRALSGAGIPFVVAGMNNLFGTAEAEAARQLFYFMAARIDAEALAAAWDAADTGAPSLDAAIQSAAATRDAMRSGVGQRFGFYSLQRTFLNFLEDAGLREELVPDGRGEVVFYNLGKFSQVISDFETIHYHSKPVEKYEGFADFLQYRAEDAYPEGWQDNQYANPDAVRVMTVHQSKGMQWPVVFVPALIRNRFPSKKQGGRGVWHLIPRAGIRGAARYDGGLEDERRLFYVAMTRSQKFLFASWAPVPGNQLYQRESEFLDKVRESRWVKRRRQDYSKRARLTPTPRAGVTNVVLTFSDIKYFFECPYQFKLRILYGFNAPIHEALGYGKSLHDALADVHARAIRGEPLDPVLAEGLVAEHLHVPYAYRDLQEALARSATRIVRDYIADNRDRFALIEFAEKTVDVHLDDGVSITGRIDLVRRKDTGDVTIVDLKSKERVQSEEVTETQLHIYALGYEELTGRSPQYVEMYDLDERRQRPRPVDEDFVQDVKDGVRAAATALRRGDLLPKPSGRTCGSCDYRRLCSSAAPKR